MPLSLAGWQQSSRIYGCRPDDHGHIGKLVHVGHPATSAMRVKSFAGMRCSIAGALEAVGDRWAFLILRDLSLGLRRFDDFQHSALIPTTTLARRLKHLQKTGLIEKTLYRGNPPRFEYRLTLKGREFVLVLIALMQWGDRWNVSGAGGPPVIPVSRESHHRVKLALLDSTSGQQISLDRIIPRTGAGADKTVRWRLSRANAYGCDA
jgi:DNA-binding HxlR family transcriptional regulator